MIDRHVHLEITPENTQANFSVERWFVPIDGPYESWNGVALVFGESVVLCSKRRAEDVWSAISSACRELSAR